MEMRKKDRQLTREEGIRLLETAEYGVLSTISEDGTPYGLPMSYAYTDGTIYMHGAKAEGHKILNIKNSSKASFTVVSNTEVLPGKFSTKYMSAIVFGKASLVNAEEERKKALIALLQKYSADFMEKGIQYMNSAIDKVYIIKVDVEDLTAKGRIK